MKKLTKFLKSEKILLLAEILNKEGYNFTEFHDLDLKQLLKSVDKAIENNELDLKSCEAEIDKLKVVRDKYAMLESFLTSVHLSIKIEIQREETNEKA